MISAESPTSNTLADVEQVLGKSIELMYSSLPAMQNIQVQSLDWEDPLEKEMATPVFSLENPMDRGAWWATVHGTLKSLLHHHSSKIMDAFELWVRHS